MKIRKSLIICFYLLLLLACLWILYLVSSPGRGKGGNLPVMEDQENEKEPGDTGWAGGRDDEEGLVDRGRIQQDVESIVRAVNRRQREQGMLQEARRRREREEWEARRRKRVWGQEEGGNEEEQPYVPPNILVASDLHYMSHTTHDDGGAFQKMVAEDDGKVSQYSDIILDTLLQEALEKRPSALVLAGDNTLNGERENHKELAAKLQKLADAGVPVLIIPGNHDIQNHSAATYFGDKREETEFLETADEFLEIYHPFGYDQALSRDPASLSYVYALDERHWMMMLDSCQYENGNRVNGRIRPGTLVWMQEQLKLAQEENVAVLPVAHHNLLSESRLYTTECTMENHDEVIALLEQFGIPLYISGHLHAQRIKKHKAAPGAAEDAYGVTEIVMGPFSIPPCQYGSLAWEEDGRMVFETCMADVASGYQREGQEAVVQELTEDDRDFLDHFPDRGEAFVKQVRNDQVEKTLYSAPDGLKAQMSRLYAELYYNYCAGNQMDWGEVHTTRAYKFWERLCPDNKHVPEMRRMVEDVRESHHDWEGAGPALGVDGAR